MYFYLYIVGSEVNVAIFSCNLFEYKRVISRIGRFIRWKRHASVVAQEARVTRNVTFLSQLVMSFATFSYLCGRNFPVLRQLSGINKVIHVTQQSLFTCALIPIASSVSHNGVLLCSWMFE